MKLIRIGEPGEEIPAVLDADSSGVEKTYDLSGLTVEIDGEFLAADGIERARRALADGTLPELQHAGRIGSPIARPQAIICVGMNYAAHAAESGSEPPTIPIIFLKTPNTLAGPYDQTVLPRNSTTTDWEVELGIVIGRRASYLESRERSGDHIAGYLVANDVSERTYQLEESGGQWSKGKCAPGFSPLGPWLVPADEVDPDRLGLRSWVNGEQRQDSTTADMIFPVDYLVHHLSQYLVLEPGDVVLTGTPEGVALSGRFPYLKPGDVVEVEIDGLGRQRQVIAGGSELDAPEESVSER
ncbi:fumarylacetoacetate hydrolase family protein [Arthrobacter sp. TMN-50]